MDAFYGERELYARMKQRGAGIRKRVKSNIARLEKKKAKMLETLAQNELAEENRILRRTADGKPARDRKRERRSP